jgi:hypothetical protein
MGNISRDVELFCSCKVGAVITKLSFTQYMKCENCENIGVHIDGILD